MTPVTPLVMISLILSLSHCSNSLSLSKFIEQSQTMTRDILDKLQENNEEDDPCTQADEDSDITCNNRHGFSTNNNVDVAGNDDGILSQVKEIYQSLNLGEVNQRFHIILDTIIPDLSLIKHLCPDPDNCEDCELEYLEVLCRACCPDQFQQPMNLSNFVHEHYDFVVDWILSSKAFQGLKVIFNNIIGNRRYGKQVEYDPQELVSFMRNFHWVHGSDDKGGRARSLNHQDYERYVKNNQTFPEDLICGYYLHGHSRHGNVMGGDVVESVASFPWQMSLATGWLGLYYQHRCGAALISSRWAVSAAHCTISSPASGLFLMGGFLNINNKNTAQIRQVEKIINHENFIAALYENDISLLRMTDSVVYNPKLLPACLPSPSSGVDYAMKHVGESAWLTGWGRKWHNGPLADQLLNVTLPILTNDQCMR